MAKTPKAEETVQIEEAAVVEEAAVAEPEVKVTVAGTRSKPKPAVEVKYEQAQPNQTVTTVTSYSGE